MKKKVFLLLILFSILFVIANVSAIPHTCTKDNDAILRLSSETNAHAEIQSQTSYSSTGYEVCYSEVTGESVPTSPPDRNCNSNNLLLKLSSNTNAHAQDPRLIGYPISVCYQYLNNCNVKDNCDLINKEEEIVRLSSKTNAHLESKTLSNYPFVLCCKVSGSIISLSANWKDMGDNIINGKEVQVGDFVKLVANGLTPSSPITFNIKDSDVFGDDDIKTLNANSDATGKAEVEWEITVADYNNGASDESDPQLELYFIADDTTNFKKSPQLFLYKDSENDPPIAKITNPSNKDIYFVDTDVSFSHASYDPDGKIINVKWIIKKSGKEESTSSTDTFQKQFSTPGQREVILELTDNKGAKGYDYVSILVVNYNKKVFSFIDSPKEREIIPLNDVKNPSFTYDASSSFALNVNNNANCPEFICIDGNCPTEVKTIPSSCTTKTVSAIPSTPSYLNLYFKWDFIGEEIFEGGGSDLKYIEGTKNYKSASNALNDKKIKLNVSYPISGSGKISSEIERTFTLGQCINNKREWIQISPNNKFLRIRSVLKTPLLYQNTWCAGIDGSLGTIDDCCPKGYYCSKTARSCVPQDLPSNAVGCQTYNDQNFVDSLNINFPIDSNKKEFACKNDPLFLVEQEPEYSKLFGVGCNELDENGNIIKCECSWSIDLNSCKFKYHFISSTPGTSLACNPSCETQTTVDSACTEGYMHATSTGIVDKGSCLDTDSLLTQINSECLASEESMVPCGKPEISLPFFTKKEFLISAILLVFIYLVILKQKLQTDF